MENTKDNKALLNGIIFMCIRAVLHVVAIYLLFLSLGSENKDLFIVGVIGALVSNILFAIVPHLFIKKISLGRASIMNLFAQILFGMICFFLLGLFGGSNEEALGWALGLSMFAFLLIMPISYLVDFLVDLIIIKAIRKN